MKATVIVTLKPTVLDPQGMTIQRSLASLGLTDISDVRQGKIFRSFKLKDGTSRTGRTAGERSSDESGH